ncbi:hypothetical protein ABPG74_018111 [Tetrahymena malaccensis]
MNKQTDFFDLKNTNQQDNFIPDKILSAKPQPVVNQANNTVQLDGQSTQDNANQSNNSSDLKNNLPLVTERRDIILENDITGQRYLMPNIEVKFLQSSENSLYFSDLVDRLKQMCFPLNDCMLFCWDEKRGMHVFVANDPMNQPHFLPSHLCGVKSNIYIKFRSYKQQPAQQQYQYGSSSQRQQQSGSNGTANSGNTANPSIKEEDNLISEDNTTFSQQNNNGGSSMEQGGKISRKKKLMGRSSNDKRVKERYIEKVREKVSEWRAMHETGFRDQNGNLQKLNLDHAANYIGISRKTLDDYYLQLRRAEQLGFDFERNKGEKMGTLRKFVKEETKKLMKKGLNNPNLTGNNNSANFESGLNMISGCENSDDEESSQDLNCLSNTGSNKNNNQANINNNNNNNNTGNNSNLILNQANSTLMQNVLHSSNPNHNQQLFTPYNLNAQTFPYSSSGLGTHNSYGQHSQNFMQASLGHGFSQNNRNSYMVQEQIGSSGLDTYQRNSNNINFNGSTFNPGSQFLNNTSHNFMQSNNNDFNIANLGDGLNQGSNFNANDQRFSNQFFINGLGNTSQIIDERNSFNNIISNMNPHNTHSNLNNQDNRQSNGSYMNMEENYITTSVNH